MLGPIEDGATNDIPDIHGQVRVNGKEDDSLILGHLSEMMNRN